MSKQAKARKRSTFSWVMEFAGARRSSYVISVLLAIANVVCGFIPFLYLANIVRRLLEGTADFSYCLTQVLYMGLFWVLSRLFHTFSTTMSHKATFEVALFINWDRARCG